MRLRISFARELTLAAISGIGTYYEAAESRLQAVEDKELAQIRDTAAAQHWEYDDWDIARQEHEMTFNMLIPNYFRYSCIVLLYLVLENKLKEICAIVQEPTCKPLPGFDRAVVARCKKYLKDTVGFSTHLWKHIEDLSKIRNYIVHASGRVEGRHAEHVGHLAKTGIGIRVSGAVGEMPAHPLPLYLEKDMIVIEPSYCRWIIKTVYEFFEGLCGALSLPAMSIDSAGESPSQIPNGGYNASED